jgi:hypothetical protein
MALTVLLLISRRRALALLRSFAILRLFALALAVLLLVF